MVIIPTKAKTRARKGGKDKQTPVRQCAISKLKLPVDELIRFVLSPEQIVTPDLRCKLPGRGLWLRADRATVLEAIKKKSFSRGFREKALASDDLVDMIEKLTRIDALHTLSLANKAGLVITGYEKIKRALAKGDVKWLLHAMEASRNGSDKLDRYFGPSREEIDDEDDDNDEDDLAIEEPLEPEREKGQNPTLGVLSALFTGDELSLALGRSNVIHIGLKRGEMARRFTYALQKSIAFDTREQGQVENDLSAS